MSIRLNPKYYPNVSEFAQPYVATDSAEQNSQFHAMGSMSYPPLQDALEACWLRCPDDQKPALIAAYGTYFGGFDPSLSYSENKA